MQTLKEKIASNKNIEKSDSKVSEWQELGKEMTKHFGQNCFWIFWKFEMWMIREAYKSAGDKGYRYFLGALNKHKREYEQRGSTQEVT